MLEQGNKRGGGRGGAMVRATRRLLSRHLYNKLFPTVTVWLRAYGIYKTSLEFFKVNTPGIPAPRGMEAYTGNLTTFRAHQSTSIRRCSYSLVATIFLSTSLSSLQQNIQLPHHFACPLCQPEKRHAFMPEPSRMTLPLG